MGCTTKSEGRLTGEDVLWEANSTLFLIIFRLTDFADRQQEVMLKSYWKEKSGSSDVQTSGLSLIHSLFSLCSSIFSLI